MHNVGFDLLIVDVELNSWPPLQTVAHLDVGGVDAMSFDGKLGFGDDINNKWFCHI